MNETKICGSCKQYLPANNEYFATLKHSKDGLNTICKSCKSAYDKEYREKNKERLKEFHKRHHQENKEKRNAYAKKWHSENKEHIKKYKQANKEKITEFNKKYLAENKEKHKQVVAKWKEEHKEHIRQYRKENRERDRLKENEWRKSERGKKLSRVSVNAYKSRKRALINTFTAKEWDECIKYFNDECAYCGCKPEVIEQEHFIPVNKNGAFVKENIITACRSCNASKADKDFSEWYPEQSFYSKERELKILDYLGKVSNERTFQIHR